MEEFANQHVAKKPVISLIVPVYNKEKYLFRCLESIKKQIYTDYEAIIIDDCSTDGSAKIIDEFCSGDERLFFLKNKANLGVSQTRNLGIERARGSFIAFIDADDVLCDDYLIEMIVGHEDCDVIMCAISRIKLNGDQYLIPLNFVYDGYYGGIDCWDNFKYVPSSCNYNKSRYLHMTDE